MPRNPYQNLSQFILMILQTLKISVCKEMSTAKKTNEEDNEGYMKFTCDDECI